MLGVWLRKRKRMDGGSAGQVGFGPLNLVDPGCCKETELGCILRSSSVVRPAPVLSAVGLHWRIWGLTQLSKSALEERGHTPFAGLVVLTRRARASDARTH